jgi:hypothetical protein
MQTPDDLDRRLAHYAAGLRTELDLLERLSGLASLEHQVSADGQLDRLPAITEARELALSALVEIETWLGPARADIAARLPLVRTRPEFDFISSLHREAGRLVADIVATDRQTLVALRKAASLRRHATQALDAGEATLAAYRRVVAPASAVAELVDQRG